MRAEFKEFSVMHEEGGWPKDINMNDPEMIQRHRKKLEKEDAFAAAVTSMTDVSCLCFTIKSFKCSKM
jgi:hypothetical protein